MQCEYYTPRSNWTWSYTVKYNNTPCLLKLTDVVLVFLLLTLNIFHIFLKYFYCCIFLSCHVRVLEWIHTLQLPECQGTPCSKQARNWSLSDWNWTRTQNHLVCNRTLNHLTKWLSVRLRTKWFWVRVQLQSFRLLILNK